MRYHCDTIIAPGVKSFILRMLSYHISFLNTALSEEKMELVANSAFFYFQLWMKIVSLWNKRSGFFLVMLKAAKEYIFVLIKNGNNSNNDNEDTNDDKIDDNDRHYNDDKCN